VAIFFHTEDTSFKLQKRDFYQSALTELIRRENAVCDILNIIFCSNNYILDINREFLNHDYFTDVITFDYVEEDRISGDIIISIEQVEMNARDYEVDFEEELERVMIHGILHLLGWSDSTAEDQAKMRKKEDELISVMKGF